MSIHLETFKNKILLKFGSLLNNNASSNTNFYLGNNCFSDIKRIKPQKGLTKAGRVSLFAHMNDQPVKIYECHSENHAKYIEEITKKLNNIFPNVLLRVGMFIVEEWVDGEQLSIKKIKRNREILNSIAQMQTTLHSVKLEKKDPPGFDYLAFLFNRLYRYRAIFPLYCNDLNKTYNDFVNSINSSAARISHPDLTLANLIKKNDNTIIIVDNEILTCSTYFYFDIFNTLYSLKNNKDLIRAYLFFYQKNGGCLTSIIKHKKIYTSMWKMRLLGSYLQAGNFNKAIELDKMHSEIIAEPIISCIEDCIVSGSEADGSR